MIKYYINKRKNQYIIICILVLIAECLYGQNNGYIIERGDILSIEVMEHPEFNRTGIIVLPDGYIQYPAIGSIMVAGYSSGQLADSIENVLRKDYVVNPIVSVYVNRIYNQSVNIFGAVNKPGRHQIFEPVEFMMAISMAGGIRDVKHVTKAVILRTDGQVETINLRKALRTKKLADLPVLYPEDTLFINERWVNWSRLTFITSVLTLGVQIISLLL